jgi:hypothetical protein
MSWKSSVVIIVTVDSRMKDYVEKGYVLLSEIGLICRRRRLSLAWRDQVEVKGGGNIPRESPAKNRRVLMMFLIYDGCDRGKRRQRGRSIPRPERGPTDP